MVLPDGSMSFVIGLRHDSIPIYRGLDIGSESGRRVAWSELAMDCGYFDQAHFAHEFRAFAWVSPSEYLRARGEWDSHVRLDG